MTGQFDTDPFDGFAFINGKLIDKEACQMTDQELADFCEQGAWRRNAYRSDDMAFAEAALRGTLILRRTGEKGDGR